MTSLQAKRIIYDSHNLTANEASVLQFLIDSSNPPDFTAMVFAKQICRATKVTDGTLRKIIKSLSSKGWLTKTENLTDTRGPTANTFTLLFGYKSERIGSCARSGARRHALS